MDGIVRKVFGKIFKKEIDGLIQKEKDLGKVVKLNQEVLKEMISTCDKYNTLYKSEVALHKRDIQELKDAIELQKIHCYLIGKLIERSDIEVPDDFNINEISHAEILRRRFMFGDLK